MNHLELVQHYYACFNRQDWEGMLACLNPQIRHDANQGDSHYGLDYFRQFLGHMDRCYSEQLKDLVIFSAAGENRFAAEFTVHGIYKATDGDLPPATGQTYVLPAGAFLEVREGKITRITTYYNLPLWLRLISQ